MGAQVLSQHCLALEPANIPRKLRSISRREALWPKLAESFGGKNGLELLVGTNFGP